MAANPVTIPKRQVTPYEKLRGQIEHLRPEIAALCGKEQVDKFVRVCLNAVQANPKVLEADRRSLLLACLKAAQDRLLPDGREAVINIYRSKQKGPGGREEWVDTCQYMPMSYGLVQQIYEAGATYVDAVPVYERDEFSYERGDDPKILHKPYLGDDDPGKVVAAYIVVKLKSGDVKREVMSRRDIERVRQKSKAPDGMMWGEFYDQGAVKSVIHRVAKQLPRSERLQRTLAHDNEAVGLRDLETSDTGGDLSALVEGQVGTAMPPAQPEEVPTTRSVPPAAEPAKAGDKGTPELKAEYLRIFGELTDTEVLSLKMDEANHLSWSKKDKAELETAYRERLEALEGHAS